MSMVTFWEVLSQSTKNELCVSTRLGFSLLNPAQFYPKYIYEIICQPFLEQVKTIGGKIVKKNQYTTSKNNLWRFAFDKQANILIEDQTPIKGNKISKHRKSETFSRSNSIFGEKQRYYFRLTFHRPELMRSDYLPLLTKGLHNETLTLDSFSTVTAWPVECFWYFLTLFPILFADYFI